MVCRPFSEVDWKIRPCVEVEEIGNLVIDGYGVEKENGRKSIELDEEGSGSLFVDEEGKGI